MALREIPPTQPSAEDIAGPKPPMAPIITRFPANVPTAPDVAPVAIPFNESPTLGLIIDIHRPSRPFSWNDFAKSLSNSVPTNPATSRPGIVPAADAAIERPTWPQLIPCRCPFQTWIC
ncbi:hypothetical protein [Nocardia sp. JCM 34519.1]|nr:hypothetical protein [Nocardia sp. JCM 34519.1]